MFAEVGVDMTMDSLWNRRRFLGTTAGSLAGLGMIRGDAWLADLGTGVMGDNKHADLPPRVVGLRTSGGGLSVRSSWTSNRAGHKLDMAEHG